MNKIRVLLADDQTLVRAGIRALLHEIPNIEVVAEAANGVATFELIEQHHPDIVLLDISMPDISGLEVARQIGDRFPGVRTVMLSGYCDEVYVMRALRVGARGYLLKGAQISELEIALAAVAHGETYLSPAASTPLVSRVLECSEDKPNSPDRLTARQMEVLGLMARGKTRKEMAHQLEVSPKTIDTYRAQIMKRLDIHELAGLVRYAIKIGLVSDDICESPDEEINEKIRA